MSYKGIRFVGFLSVIMMAVLVVGSMWQVFGGDASPRLNADRQPLWVAFLFLGLLAERVGSILECQADEIAHLKRRLEERAPSAS